MALRSTEDCVKERLVEFIHNPRDRMRESSRFSSEADYSLKSAKDFLKTGYFKYSIVAAYDSMEAKAKALLALRGIKPKMHKCVFLYLRQEFVGKNLLKKQDVELIENAHIARVQAHYIFGSKVSETRAKSVLESAVYFIEKINQLSER